MSDNTNRTNECEIRKQPDHVPATQTDFQLQQSFENGQSTIATSDSGLLQYEFNVSTVPYPAMTAFLGRFVAGVSSQ